jgi:pheromone shutdown protein TraB
MPPFSDMETLEVETVFKDQGEITLAAIMQEDVITLMMKELQNFAPTISEVLLHERDDYISKKILDASSKGKVVAVVGAGHLKGIKATITKALEKKEKKEARAKAYAELEVIPEKGFSYMYGIVGIFLGILVGRFLGMLHYPHWDPLIYNDFLAWIFNGFVRASLFWWTLAGMIAGFMLGGKGGLKAIGYAVPVLFIFLIVYLALNNKWDDVKEALMIWIFWNCLCAFISAVVVMAHPASIAAGTFISPWTSLNPAVAAGWVAGLVELTVRKPTNKDLLELFSGTYETLRQYYRNKVFKVILVTAFVNIGSSIGAYIAGVSIYTGLCI